MTDDFDRLPGEPLQHGRNWSPATTFEEYVRNVREGLEAYSDRRAARLLGWPRIAIYRAKLMAELPEPLFEALMDADVLSAKALAQVALAQRRDVPYAHDDEYCPHCDGLLCRRRHISKKAAAAIVKTLVDETAA
jgi:hypothetical protein